MFWGLQLEANLRYSQQVPEGFRITKATLSTETPPGPARSQDPAAKLVQVFVDQEGSDYAIATLKHGEIYDCSMDLRFAEGEDICFYLKGEGVVFLTGHNLDSNNHDFENFLHDAGSSDDDDVDDEESEEDTSDDEESIIDITEADKKAKQDPTTRAINGNLPVKKISAVKPQNDEDDELDSSEDGDSADEDEDLDEDDDADENDDDEDEESDDSEDDQEDDVKPVPGLKRSDVHAQLKSKLPDAKKAKLQNGAAPSAKQANGNVKRAPEAAVKSLQSAGKGAAPASLTNDSVKELIIEDLTQGSGPVAKKGRTVKVYYTGKLLNGKQFDSVKSGKPFEFKLGAQRVIKGWDKGLEGMRVGGKRRLVIPANLAYGKQKMGPIPAGSALRFEIELKGVA